MSANTFEYDFRGAVKPCGTNGPTQDPNPQGSCTGMTCCWFAMCNLSIKEPPTRPTLPQQGRTLR